MSWYAGRRRSTKLVSKVLRLHTVMKKGTLGIGKQPRAGCQGGALIRSESELRVCATRWIVLFLRLWSLEEGRRKKEGLDLDGEKMVMESEG